MPVRSRSQTRITSNSIGNALRRSESVEANSLINVTGTRRKGRPSRCVSITTSASKANPSMVVRPKISSAAWRRNSFSPHCVSVTSRETMRLTTARKANVAKRRASRRRARCSAPSMSRAPKTTSRLAAADPLVALLHGRELEGEIGVGEGQHAAGGASMAMRMARPLPPCGVTRNVEHRGPTRAFAAMITPALKMGGFIRGFIPVDVREADQPQTGKGFSLHVVRAIYRETAYPIALKSGGVGSLDESISSALISGKPFIAIDNVRGRLNSQFLEMILTWCGEVSARIPHQGEVLVDPGAASFQLTSNGIEATPDFAKRASITRMLKQPPGFSFKRFAEGICATILPPTNRVIWGRCSRSFVTGAGAGSPRQTQPATTFENGRASSTHSPLFTWAKIF